MELYNEIEFYAKVNSKVIVGWDSKVWVERLFGKLEIHSKPHILRMRLSIWQDSQDKRSGRSITCFVRKWKEKVAWPRLTKEDIKVGVWGMACSFSCAVSAPGDISQEITLGSFPTNIQSLTKSYLTS